MRRVLSNLGSDERHTFRAQFGKYGYKRFHDPIKGVLYSPTMVVRNVEIIDDPSKPTGVTDHLWLNLTKSFSDLGLLEPGDIIQFNGLVAQYTKGYGSTSVVDYKLTYPSKVILQNQRETLPIPKDHTALIGMIMNLNYDFYKVQKRPLVPFFMDAFKKWQESQIKTLPIECHEGNSYESDLGYDALNYKQEMKELEAKKQAQQEANNENEAEGIEFLKSHKLWLDELKKLASENENKISNRILTQFLQEKTESKKQLMEIRVKIRAAVKSDWFESQLNDENKTLSPLELLAKKLNSR